MMLDIRQKIRQFRLYKYKRTFLGVRGKTVICNNCTGAMVLHDYGLRFDTPTVNLFIRPKFYIEMLRDLNNYLIADIVDISDGNKYPIGLLGDKIRIDFLHYETFDDAVKAWKRRVCRIDLNNIYVVLVERDGCTYDDLMQFDNLPFKHKVALVHKEYPEIQCSYVIECPQEKGLLGQIINYQGLFGKRYYDQFNWYEFLELNKK